MAVVGRVVTSKAALLVRAPEPVRLWSGAPLRRGMRLRVPAGGSLVFLVFSEDMTYQVVGPADITILDKGARVAPATAKLAKSRTTAEERARATPKPAARKPPPPRPAVVEAPRPLPVVPADAATKRAADMPTQANAANRNQFYDRARSLERAGRYREAMRLYEDAALAGHGLAALRLGNIHGTGPGDITRDYEQQLRWYERADALGVPAPRAQKR